MIVLDTNVLSALMNEVPERRVIAWLDKQPRTSIWTTAVTVLEIRFGLQILPGGKRRVRLMRAFDQLLEKIENRVLSFDRSAAEVAGDLMAWRRSKGRPVDLRDTMIAGIVIAQHASMATRNVAHFNDLSISVVDPWSH
jgi:predicted nucleic acid-binding protein